MLKIRYANTEEVDSGIKKSKPEKFISHQRGNKTISIRNPKNVFRNMIEFRFGFN